MYPSDSESPREVRTARLERGASRPIGAGEPNNVRRQSSGPPVRNPLTLIDARSVRNLRSDGSVCRRLRGEGTRRFARAIRNRNLLNAEMAAREIGELSLPDALAFCLPLAEVDPQRFDRAIPRWHARFVLQAQGITADEAALALSAAKGLAGLKTRDVAAQILRRLAHDYGLSGSRKPCNKTGEETTADRPTLVAGVGPSSIRRAVSPQSPCDLSRRGPPPPGQGAGS
jgi:hypothetical protein